MQVLPIKKKNQKKQKPQPVDLKTRKPLWGSYLSKVIQYDVYRLCWNLSSRKINCILNNYGWDNFVEKCADWKMNVSGNSEETFNKVIYVTMVGKPDRSFPLTWRYKTIQAKCLCSAVKMIDQMVWNRLQICVVVVYIGETTRISILSC